MKSLNGISARWKLKSGSRELSSQTAVQVINVPWSSLHEPDVE